MLTGDTLFIGDVGRPDLRVALGWSAAISGACCTTRCATNSWRSPTTASSIRRTARVHSAARRSSKETVSHDRRAAALELRAAADEQGRVHRARHRGSTRRAAVLHVRRGVEQPRTADARSGAGARTEPAAARPRAYSSGRGRSAAGYEGAGEFAAAHLKGSLNIGLGGQYATWAGTMLDHEQPIVIMADPGREHESAVRLGRIGFDHIAGYLADGMRSLESRPDLTGTTERISAPLAAERLAGRCER